MHQLVERYRNYLEVVKRYSSRTVSIYMKVLEDFLAFSQSDLLESFQKNMIRSYQVYLLDEKKLVPKTVNLHLSVLSGFSRFLIKEKLLVTNPIKLISRPKEESRLPFFYKKDELDKYFSDTQIYSSEEFLQSLLESDNNKTRKYLYKKRLDRLVISLLYGLGIRRSELIDLKVEDVNFARKIVKVRGKGDKMREIPLIGELSKEILLYLKSVEAIVGESRSLKDTLLVTQSGAQLYPVFVDRVLKQELGERITGQKSPHILRHSLATELLNDGVDINSIKELLGHSSLAATQVYTHNSIAKMKSIYKSAHPRQKKEVENGD